jgi:hypothetical protein
VTRFSTSRLISETVFTRQRSYQVPNARIREHGSPIIVLRGLQLPHKQLDYRAVALSVQQNSLTFHTHDEQLSAQSLVNRSGIDMAAMTRGLQPGHLVHAEPVVHPADDSQ